jgi:hypothetical protein
MYIVSEDLVKATDPKVHRTSCGHYQRWRREGSETTTWHGPYATREEAWKICQQIANRMGKQPVEAACCMN